MVKIYLDAGHGGKDAGAVGNGIKEKDINLELIKQIETKLKDYEDVQVLLTRDTDIFLSLQQRTDKANHWGAHYFLSCHVNSSPNKDAKGFESHRYVGTKDPKTIAFQNVMHENIVGQIKPLGISDRGKKASDFHVVRESRMPALLTENLFISNVSDSNQLKRNEFLEKLSDGHVLGLEKFIGLKKSKQPPRTGATAPETPKKLFKVQVGAFADEKNAVEQVNKLIKDGYKAFIVEE